VRERLLAARGRLRDAIGDGLLPLEPEAIERLTELAAVVALALLLVLGAVLDSALGWVLVALPMTLIVATILVERAHRRSFGADGAESMLFFAEPSVAAERPAPLLVATDDQLGPIVVRRVTPAPVRVGPADRG
jgi:hypothetical protein